MLLGPPAEHISASINRYGPPQTSARKMTNDTRSSDSPDNSLVATAHDRMVDEYDQIDDLWYRWLYVQVHEFIASHLITGAPSSSDALDVGCGTGFQSFLLARAGHQTTGFDISRALVARACEKNATHAAPPLVAPPLFESSYDDGWSTSHHRRLALLLERARRGRAVNHVTFLHEDIETFGFERRRFGVITCCGSVLNFVRDWPRALQQMAEALAPSGMLFIEVEQRYNLDLVWPVIDRVLRGTLEYEQSWTQIGRNLFAPPAQSAVIEYPFELRDGTVVTFPMHLPSTVYLERLCRSLNLAIVDRLAVHHITNLLPSTVLHRQYPSAPLRQVFAALRCVDRLLARWWLASRASCNIIYCLRRAAH